MTQPLRKSGLGTASQAFGRARECDRLAALTRDAQRRGALLRLKCSWIQFAAEIRSNEVVRMARIEGRNTSAPPQQITNDRSNESSTEGRTDGNDGKPWSIMDIVDLDNHARAGATAREAAQFLSRSGTIGDVKATAERRGLRLV
jgi:hypothetical protein